MKKAIFLTNAKGNVPYVYSDEQRAYLSSIVDIDPDAVYAQEDLEANPDAFRDVEYIFSTWGMPGSAEDDFSLYFPNAKALFYAAGTVRYFARPWIEHGIRVFSAPAANAIPVAEWTLAQILLANKGYFLTAPLASNGKYDEAKEIMGKFKGNYKTKVGIIGVGAIGRRVIELLRPFVLDVLVFDAFLSDEDAAALGVKKVSLETLFSECTVISNHLANVPATVGMLNYDLFSRMGEGTTFINTGRGAQVVEDDLVRAMREKPYACAVLDVTDPEPPVEGSPIYELPNIVLTPHSAGSAGNEVSRMAQYMIEEYERFTAGKPTLYEVTRERFDKMA